MLKPLRLPRVVVRVGDPGGTRTGNGNMKIWLRNGTTALIALAFATSVSGSQVVREFRGTQNTTTAAFTVEAPWILDWRLDGDYDQLVALQITLVDARTGRHIGQVKQVKRKSNGVRLFDTSGTFQFRVSGTLARWTLKVEQLTPEEAKLYTPVKPPSYWD